MIKWKHLQKEPGGTAVKRMDWWEGARSPLSTNTEGGGDGFERGVGAGSDLITTCSELREREKRRDWERHTESEWSSDSIVVRLCTGSIAGRPGQDSRPEIQNVVGAISGNFDFLHTSLSLLSKHFERRFRGLLRGRNISEIELKRKDLWELLGNPQRETGRSSKRQTQSAFAVLDWNAAASCGSYLNLNWSKGKDM